MDPEQLFKEVRSRKPANETLKYSNLFICAGDICQVVKNNPQNMEVRIVGIYKRKGFDTLAKCLMTVRRDERDLFKVDRHEAAVLLNHARKQRAKLNLGECINV